MSAGFLETNRRSDSPLEQLDPRAKLIAVTIAVVCVSSESCFETQAAVPYLGLILALLLAARLDAVLLFRRAAVAGPFILAAAAAPLLSLLAGDGIDTSAALRMATALAWKGSVCILLLVVLTLTTAPASLFWALERSGAPRALTAIIALTYRYFFVLWEEWRRASRARLCRAPAGLRQGRASLYGKQIAMVFVKGWERADRIHAAMLVRGFQGTLPIRAEHRWSLADSLFAVVLAGAFVAVRVFG